MTTNRPDDELNCEEYYNEVVDHLDDEHNPRELNIARGILFVMVIDRDLAEKFRTMIIE